MKSCIYAGFHCLIHHLPFARRPSSLCCSDSPRFLKHRLSGQPRFYLNLPDSWRRRPRHIGAFVLLGQACRYASSNTPAGPKNS